MNPLIQFQFLFRLLHSAVGVPPVSEVRASSLQNRRAGISLNVLRDNVP